MYDQASPATSRNPFLVLGGFTLLGIAVAFLLFGNSLFGRPQRPEGIGPLAGETVPDHALELDDLRSGAATASDRVLAPDTGTLSVGDLAPNFVLADLAGEPVSLAQFRGQPVIINFWATWCPPCRVEMPDLQLAYEKYSADGLVILALDQAEPANLVRSFFYDEMELTFTPLLDEHGLVSGRYGIFSFPTSLFVDRTGKIVAIHRGLMTGDQLDGYLSGLLVS